MLDNTERYVRCRDCNEVDCSECIRNKHERSLAEITINIIFAGFTFWIIQAFNWTDTIWNWMLHIKQMFSY